MAIKSIEQSITNIFNGLSSIKHEVEEIENAYFNTGASDLVGALATDGTAATVSTKLTKLEFINGIVLCQQLHDFFTNSATSQSNYINSALNLINGTTAAGGVLSADVEYLGEKMKAVAESVLARDKEIRDVLKLYNDSELTLAINALSSGTIVFETKRTKTMYSNAIFLLTSLGNLLNNISAPQGDFEGTLAVWSSVS